MREAADVREVPSVDGVPEPVADFIDARGQHAVKLCMSFEAVHAQGIGPGRKAA